MEKPLNTSPSLYPLNSSVNPPRPSHQTIYVEKLPEAWPFHDFRRVLHHHGIVGMTSISIKCNSKGLWFGFVHLHPNWGVCATIRNINGIFYGSNHFRKAFESRYPRIQKPTPRLTRPHPIPSR